MTAYLTTYDGGEYELPKLIEWSFTHTMGDSADGFYVEFIYDKSMKEILPKVTRLKAVEGGNTMFYGVTDEYEISADGAGCKVAMSGRGMAALLMDNESEAMEYSSAVLASILKDHTEPYGIYVAAADKMRPLSGYRISSGDSEWKVLKEFTYWSAGVTPRFSPSGELILSKEPGKKFKASKSSGIISARLREKRYGVISEVLVKGNTSGVRSTVYNGEFISEGGICKRVICVPNYTGYDTMRYTGEYQIEQSEKEKTVLEISLAKPFEAFANDLIEVQLSEIGVNGTYIVSESVSWSNGSGCGTDLKLLPYRG